MAETLRLQSNNYQSCEPSLVRRGKRLLNPIIEEESDDGVVRKAEAQRLKRHGPPSHLTIEAWLSPMSDHFPTPRGVHYLAAPVLPSSPSTESGGGSSPTTSSNQWNNRASIATENTEFEDLYDVSEEEEDLPPCVPQSYSDARSRGAKQGSRQPIKLIIPPSREGSGDSWSAVDEIKKITSPVPLTPSTQLPMSPAQLKFMDKQQSMDVLDVSAPPSLDGSLSSEQLATMSAPPTPNIGNDDGKPEETWTGVQLQPGALATLQALSGADEEMEEQPSQVLEIPDLATRAGQEMQQQSLRLVTAVAPPSAQQHIHSPSPHRQSLASLTRLDIPSPGGFFSGLSPRTRNAWDQLNKAPAEMPPPTSTTAEQFYRCPWNTDTSVPPVPQRPNSAEDFYRSVDLSSEPVEQTIEVPEEAELSDDMPTARPVLPHQDSDESGETIKPTSPQVEEAPTEIVVTYDPDYARKQQKVALSHLDRTELWLLAQRAYLKGVDHTVNEVALKTIEESPEEEEPVTDPAAAKGKKVVRFSNVIPTTVQPKRIPCKLLRQESAYYRAFQDYIIRTQLRDVFVHQLSRFEALQAQRVALRETHRNQLLGKYQLSVVPQSAKKRLSANVARGDDILTDDPEKLRREKEFEATSQMTLPTWHVAALKYLQGGRLITAPVTKRLARVSRMAPRRDGVTRDRARILDLGGQSTCDWVWHCALMYPNTKVYTVTTKKIRQLSNANIRGPPNHRQVAVEKLARLPFANDQFDLISARELHGILKFVGENGEDEWETCLSECMRVLKPGGYLEFSVLDSDIINAGPLGLAKSVEFGFTLKTLGYDPSPSKLWLRRLSRAGFGDIRRAWMCLPLGAKRKVGPPPIHINSDGVSIKEGKVCQMDAIVSGSSDSVASVCSILGGWSWERWLLRCEMEKVAGELRLVDTVTAGPVMKEAGKCLEDVHAVMEEGRGCKAGFRMLNGYARKPRLAVNGQRHLHARQVGR